MKKFFITAFLVTAFAMMFLSVLAIFKNRLEYATIFTAASMVAIIISNVISYVDMLDMESDMKKMVSEMNNFKSFFFPQENQSDYIKKVLDRIPYAARADIQKQSRENEAALEKDLLMPKLSGYTDDEILELNKCNALPSAITKEDINRLRKINASRGVKFSQFDLGTADTDSEPQAVQEQTE